MNGIRKTCRKENGSTLVVVLLVMAVFSVLGLTLIGVSLAHSQQISQSAAKIQATNAAEMGIKAYDQKITDVLETINHNVPDTFSAFKTALDSALPNELNSDESVSSMQGDPRYAVTVLNETANSANQIQFTLKSEGNAGNIVQTVTQVKTFTYHRGSDNTNTGDSDHTPEYFGLSLPYMDGSLIMGDTSNWNLSHPQGSGLDNIYISPYMDQKCFGATYKSSISDFDNTFNQIESLFIQNTSVQSNVADMPDQKPDVPENLPNAPQSWTINGADSNDSYQTSNDDASYKNNGHYTQSVNFNRTIDFNDSGSLTYDHDVSVDGRLTISTPTTIKGDLYVTGGISVNQPLTVEGNVFIKNGSLDINALTSFKGNTYVNGPINIKNDISFGTLISGAASTGTGNVYATGSITVNDGADTSISGNVFAGEALNLSANTTIGGSAYSVGSLTITGTKTTIGGFAYTGRSLTISTETTIGNEVYSSGSLTVNNNAKTTMKNDVYTGGALSLFSDTTIGGNTYSEDSLTVNSGAQTSIGGAVYTGKALTLSSDTAINGAAYSSGAMTINSGAATDVGGNLYVGGALTINEDSNFTGNVYSSGYLGINSTANFSGYVFTADSMNRNSNPDNKPASQFARTVYVKGSAYITQGPINSDVNPHILDFKQGAVINRTAGYTTSGGGEIHFGHQQHGGTDGSGSGSSAGTGSVSVTVAASDTNYK